MTDTLIVLGSKGLQEAFDTLEVLAAKADSKTAPTTSQEAVAWVNDSATPEIRKARKTLAFGLIYNAGPLTFKSVCKKI